MQRLGRKAKETAAEIGEDLIKVKQGLAHGEFGPWCEANLSPSRTHITRYMKAAKIKMTDVGQFEAADTLDELVETKNIKQRRAEKPETRSATLDDLRKVERLRALRDDPSATEGEKENAQRKLDEIEKEIGKVEPEAQRNDLTLQELSTSLTKTALKKAAKNEKAFEIVEWAMRKAYGHSDKTIQRVMNTLNGL